jgi:hypothetical protein
MHISKFVKQLDFTFQTPKLRGKTRISNCGFCQDKDVECGKYFGSNFVNYDYLTNQYICLDCANLFDDNVRKKCFYANKKEGFRTIQQSEFADILRNPVLPCILSFSESRQMGRLYKSKINYTPDNFTIECDKYRVTLDLNTDVELMDWLENIYNKYKVSKSWLLNNTIPTTVIFQMGEEYFQYLDKTKDLLNTPKLSLLLAFCNASEDKKRDSNFDTKSEEETLKTEKQMTELETSLLF